MTRKLALVILAMALALSGCKKLQLPSNNKQAETETQPAAEGGAAAPSAPDVLPGDAPSAPDVASAEPPKAAKPVAARSSSQVVVLCYHRLEGKAGGALSIEPALFEEHMQKIKDAGLTVISMQDFLAWQRGEKEIPPKCVLITIDDGYVSAYEVGWPILKKFEYPFTMFVYLNYISAGGKSITWEQLAEMRDAGVDIGSHTVSHQDLRKKGKGAADYDTFLKDEVERSKQVIEEKLGIRCLSIAYPQGRYNEKVSAAVKAAGYAAGFSTYGMRIVQGTDLTALGRYDVTAKDAQGRDGFTIATSFQGMVSSGASPAMTAEAASSMITQPMSGETVKSQTPAIKANLSTMGEVDPASVEMRISGVGLVKAQYDAASKTISYNVPEAQKLNPGSYSVIITANVAGRKAEARWSFSVDPNAAPSGAAEDTLPPRAPR